MKKIFLLSTIFLLISTFVFSQEIIVTETRTDIADGNKNALEVTIYKSDKKTIEKQWKRLMKDYDADVNSKKEIFADNALVKKISENTIDIYAKVEEGKDDEIVLYVAFDLGGAFLSSSQHSSQFNEAKELVIEFAKTETENGFNKLIEEEEKALKGLESKLDRMNSDKEHLEKEIEDYKERIEKNTDEINKITKDLDEKTKEIDTQSQAIDNLKKEAKKVK